MTDVIIIYTVGIVTISIWIQPIVMLIAGSAMLISGTLQKRAGLRSIGFLLTSVGIVAFALFLFVGYVSPM